MTFLLIIIYISFISLGLPDSLLGSAWPVMQGDLKVAYSSAGIISMIISGGTIISSFMSGRLIQRFGTGKVTVVSVFMTAAALLGFYLFPSFYWLCLMAVPLGLGAGAVDSALNNFVALHYKASHMSWLHCFWGLGATSGPIILSYFLGESNGWRKGYLTISIIQFSLVAILFLTLGQWKKNDSPSEEEAAVKHASFQEVFALRGVKAALLSFFCYCAAEMTAGLWGSSFLVKVKGITPDIAARWVSLFYVGITVGRFICGFITMKFSNKTMIRTGQIICGLGAVILMLPLPNVFSAVGLSLIGLGCAPIYPCMLHETPKRFGENMSQSLMGIQMAFAYIGTTLMPPILGVIASKFSIGLFPYFLFLLVFTMLISSEKINSIVKNREV